MPQFKDLLKVNTPSVYGKKEVKKTAPGAFQRMAVIESVLYHQPVWGYKKSIPFGFLKMVIVWGIVYFYSFVSANPGDICNGNKSMQMCFLLAAPL